VILEKSYYQNMKNINAQLELLKQERKIWTMVNNETQRVKAKSSQEAVDCIDNLSKRIKILLKMILSK